MGEEKVVSDKSENERAEEVYKKSIFINCRDGGPMNAAYLESLTGRVTGVNKSIYARPKTMPNLGSHQAYDYKGSAYREAMDSFIKYLSHLEKFSNIIVHTNTAEDIVKAKKYNKVAVIVSFQNGTPIEDDVGNLRIFQKLGLNIMQLTYQERNLIGNGCGERSDEGLSLFGVNVIEEMNKLGIVIDLSHGGFKTTMDAMEFSKKPVIFSHSNPKGYFNAPRNITDEQIKILADNNGVMGLTDFKAILNGFKVGTTVNEYLDCMEYVIKLVGVNHVGIGNDHVEDQSRPREDAYRDYVRYPEISQFGPFEDQWPIEKRYAVKIPYSENTLDVCRGLVARGYSDQEITKILGGNFLRVFKSVWK